MGKDVGGEILRVDGFQAALLVEDAGQAVVVVEEVVGGESHIEATEVARGRQSAEHHAAVHATVGVAQACDDIACSLCVDIPG